MKGHAMRKIVIAVTAAVLGASAYTAVANPTLDFSPNKVWRNAPESTALEQRAEGATEGKRRLIPAYEQEQPFTFNP
jgi:hypothetical protein